MSKELNDNHLYSYSNRVISMMRSLVDASPIEKREHFTDEWTGTMILIKKNDVERECHDSCACNLE